MTLATPRDLFLHELSDTLSAENIILGMLEELQQETQHPDIKSAVTHHHKETQQQIKNVEKIFEQLGAQPEQTSCYAAEGLKQEHDSLKEEQSSPSVLELGNLAGASKTEHYEIASYTALVQMARDMGEKEAVELLKENLAQEKEMARTVESLAKQLGKEVKAEMKEQEKEAATA